MAYSPEQAHLKDCANRMKKFPGWKVMGNIPDFDKTVVYHEKLKMVTQIHDKNYDLLQYLNQKDYHPRYTIPELEMLFGGAPTQTGLGMEMVNVIPSGVMMRRWFDVYVSPRLIQERKKINELLGTSHQR